MNKEQLERLIYEAFHEGYCYGYTSNNLSEKDSQWQEYRAWLAKTYTELGW